MRSDQARFAAMSIRQAPPRRNIGAPGGYTQRLDRDDGDDVRDVTETIARHWAVLFLF